MEYQFALTNNRENIRYKSYLLLSRLSEQGSMFTGLSRLKILKILLEVFKELSLNEIEITLLGIYLDKFGWRCQENIEEAIFLAGFAAKCYLNENITEIENFLKQKYHFFTNYKKWIFQYRLLVSVGYNELNHMYNKLTITETTSEETDSFDYNQIVIDLIDSSSAKHDRQGS